MASKGKIEIQLIRPEKVLNDFAQDAWSRSIPDVTKWMQGEFIRSLVYSGNGIIGIKDTEFYKFITSHEGLSELGIDASEPPKLLQAYATTAFNISVTNSEVTLEFGEYAKLIAATPHPADGTGHLHITSWLEWVDGLEVKRGYVSRGDLPSKSQNAIRLGDPLGGLMLPRGAFGSTGLWRFPDKLRNYEDKWFRDNIDKIETILTDKMMEIFAKHLVG